MQAVIQRHKHEDVTDPLHSRHAGYHNERFILREPSIPILVDARDKQLLHRLQALVLFVFEPALEINLGLFILLILFKQGTLLR